MMASHLKSIFMVKIVKGILTTFVHSNIASSISKYYLNKLNMIAFEIKEKHHIIILRQLEYRIVPYTIHFTYYFLDHHQTLTSDHFCKRDYHTNKVQQMFSVSLSDYHRIFLKINKNHLQTSMCLL